MRNRTSVRRWGCKLKLIIFSVMVIFVLLISVLRYRNDEVNYLDADATWHVLLTIQAYEETPVSDHLFLPIVSLGEESDKYIPWGATVPDDKGNYYYTSFSPAGYFVAWLFIKILGLEICEKSLYIFNTFLLTISAVLWLSFIHRVYREKNYSWFIAVIAVMTYVLSPEILHGMGIVYWSQSLMQVTLLAQIYTFYVMKETQSKKAKVLFYVCAFLNPYIEWTGFVANVGFALCELIDGGRKEFKNAFIDACKLGIITITSFGAFCLHYLARIDSTVFFDALKNRFMARNVMTAVELTQVFGGYFKSFLYLWVLLLILLIWNIAVKKNIEVKHGLLMLAMAFPVIENVIMKEHALSYSYDRMKMAFVFSFIICDLIVQIIEYYNGKKIIIYVLGLITFAMGILNFKDYMANEQYIWNTSYRAKNSLIAGYINSNYSDSVLAIENGAVRGYVNLLFGRGVYEFRDVGNVMNMAQERNNRYAIMLQIESFESGGVYDFSGATIYDTFEGTVRTVSVENDEIKDVIVGEMN